VENCKNDTGIITIVIQISRDYIVLYQMLYVQWLVEELAMPSHPSKYWKWRLWPHQSLKSNRQSLEDILYSLPPIRAINSASTLTTKFGICLTMSGVW
jgi:hypothetical protein